MRWLTLWIGLTLVAITASAQSRVKLDGLDAAAVERKIGPPAEKEELADSNEVYWIYKTRSGTLSVHFQNSVVVDINPPDFPVETILK
jgi:hypothetical protein